MGTIAARDCLRVLQLSEQVVAACLMASVQAVELRCAQLDNATTQLSVPLQQTISDVREVTAFLTEDRALEPDLRALVSNLQQRNWQIYAC